MAVRLEYISLIVPIEKIEEHYPGGFSQYKIDMRNSIGHRIWYDEYIVRDGAMNEYGIGRLINDWESFGLEGAVKEDGKELWKDLCVVDQFMGATLPCDWLKFEGDSVSHIKDNSKKVIDRDDMSKHFKTASENTSDMKKLRAEKYGLSFKIIDREFIETKKSTGRIISVGQTHFLVLIEADGESDIIEIPFVETSMKDPYSETDNDLFIKTSALLDRMYSPSILQTRTPFNVMNIEKWTEAVNITQETIKDKIKLSDVMKVYSQPNEGMIN